MPVRHDAFGQPVGEAMEHWVSRVAPPATPMLGRYCEVVPLDVERHAERLHVAYAGSADGRGWTYLFAPAFPSFEEYREGLIAAVVSGDPMPHAIIDAAGEPVGTASFMRIDRANGVIEVGHIHYGPALQRRAAATEAMALMMRRAFDELGYRRYEWKCDSLNAPSRAAALRLGFTFEGVFRQHMIIKGRNRDTAWFSMLDTEWPSVKRGFAAWLAPDNFDAEARQRRALAEVRNAAG